MSPIFRNLGKIPEETAHVLQNLVGAKGLNWEHMVYTGNFPVSIVVSAHAQ